MLVDEKIYECALHFVKDPDEAEELAEGLSATIESFLQVFSRRAEAAWERKQEALKGRWWLDTFSDT